MNTQEKGDTHMVTVTSDVLDKWATDPGGPVGLHLKQRLLPADAIDIDGDEGIIFPPTYADIGYNVDTLSDGRKVVTIDTVGSQANRLEPLFKAGGPFADLVPQIEIEIAGGASVSIFDIPHRAADATVLSSDLVDDVANAFDELRDGNAVPLCVLAPTSLVFGSWDSRGGTGEKRPRLVRSIIRAWDVDVLHAAAQFNSVWKKLDEDQQRELKKEAKAKKAKLSEKGLADAPATFRKTTKVPQYRDGAPNPEARVLGGVLVKGRIDRELTVNLVALRGLRGKSDEETRAVRRYLLGLTLLAATADIDLYLREGCLLRYAGEDAWYATPRRGNPEQVDLSTTDGTIRTYAEDAAERFKVEWPKGVRRVEFDLRKAKRLLAKETEEEVESPE